MKEKPANFAEASGIVRRYRELHPPADRQDATVLDRLAEDCDGRVTAAFGLLDGARGMEVIAAVLDAARLADVGPGRVEKAAADVVQNYADLVRCVDRLASWAAAAPVAAPKLGQARSVRDMAVLVAEAQDVLPRLAALLRGLAGVPAGRVAALPIGRKKHGVEAQQMAGMRHLIGQMRELFGQPHGRAGALLIEAALGVEELPAALVERAARPDDSRQKKVVNRPIGF